MLFRERGKKLGIAASDSAALSSCTSCRKVAYTTLRWGVVWISLVGGMGPSLLSRETLREASSASNPLSYFPRAPHHTGAQHGPLTLTKPASIMRFSDSSSDEDYAAAAKTGTL